MTPNKRIFLMIDTEEFVEALSGAGVDFFCGVPDSLLKNFCAYLTDHCAANHVITANEGGAVALAAGHYLATGKPALVYMQNSGQGNAVNPLASLADPDVYSIPMVLLVGWRGEPGVHDEPQHVKQGKITVSLFETLGIPTYIVPDADDGRARTPYPPSEASCEAGAMRGAAPPAWDEVVRKAVAESVSASRPVALIVRKGLLGEYKLQNKKPDIATLPREQAIEGILASLPPDAVIVSTTGMISRELYEIRERKFHCSTSNLQPSTCHSQDFLTVGSMGHASMIALGIAKARPDRTVVCLDGDGASIMQMGNMAIVGQSRCANLVHIVLNNAAHDSVGGQPTVGGAVDLPSIAAACGYAVIDSIDSSTFNLQPSTCPKFFELRVAKGARKDLGRPKEPPQVNKALFMETLRKS